MTIAVIPGEQAVETRKTNPHAQWGNRNEVNRVEPITSPAFAVPFTIAPGANIFTIGSCFARNVEKELLARGYRVPIRDIFRTEAFAGLDLGVINNFGTPSIYNEFAWAFGAQPFDEASCFAEVMPGKFVDLHLSPTLRPASLETVRARRTLILAATRELAACSVLIMTLGLVELWYDRDNATYLNVAPRPASLKQAPGRFEVHVLDYPEVVDYLGRAIELARVAAGPELRIILTVSPVPLLATHRDMDVITANCYSKSVLRAAAEVIAVRFPQVVYFPSYESVTLSERTIAWEPDLIHVTPRIVAFNVGRMMAAFTGTEGAATIGSEDEAVAAAKTARANSDLAFFDTNRDWSARSERFALEHAGLLELVDREGALAVLAALPAPSHSIVIRRAAILRDARRPAEAVALLEAVCRPGEKSPGTWPALVDAHVANGDAAGATAAARRWIATMPIRKGSALVRLGRGLRRLGEAGEARRVLEEALEVLGDDEPGVALELAETLLALGEKTRADAMLDGLVTLDAAVLARRDALRDPLAAKVAS